MEQAEAEAPRNRASWRHIATLTGVFLHLIFPVNVNGTPRQYQLGVGVDMFPLNMVRVVVSTDVRLHLAYPSRVAKWIFTTSPDKLRTGLVFVV